MMIAIRMNVSKIFALRSTGTANRMPVPEFQVALKAEPELYAEWISALRLDTLRNHLGKRKI